MQEPFVMTISEYEKLIQVAEKINKTTDDLKIKTQKGKFPMRTYIPTEEELEEHLVREKFLTYLPYLVYFREPGLCKDDGEGRLKALRKYLSRLFDEMLYIDFGEEDELG